MRLSLLALLLAVPFAGCQFESRPDGGNPDHTGADNAEQDAYDASTGSQGATPLASPDGATAAQEALGGAPAAPMPAADAPEMPAPPNGAPPPPPPPPPTQ